MSDEFLNSIRLTNRQRHDLLQNLELSTQSVVNSKRRHTRHECRLADVRIEVTHPVGGTARFLVCTRNISAGGLAFLHGGFLYPGCRCEVTLPTLWGVKETQVGSIIACRHISKHIHEFSMSFESLIDTRRYLSLPSEGALQCEPDDPRLRALAGAVLMIDESVANTDLTGHHLKPSSVEFIGAESFTEAIVTVRSASVDTVLIDLDNRDRSPGEQILDLREAGYKGPIVGVTSQPDSGLTRSALAAGADEILARPISSSDLVRVLSECLSGNTGGSGPILCQLDCNADTLALVETYLGYIKKLSTKLTEGVVEDDLRRVLQCCRGIARSAGGYGFPQLEQAARDVEVALQRSNSVSESISELQRLRNVCGRLGPMELP